MSAARAIAEVALEVARARARKLAEMRAALERGDDARALALLRVYVGLDEGEGDAGDRTDPGLH